MYVRKINKTNNRVSIRIVESVRVDGQVKQKTVCCIGSANGDDQKKIDSLMRVANEMVIKIENEIKPSLPGFEEIMFGKFGGSAKSRNNIKEEKKENENCSLNEDDQKVNWKTLVEEKRINVGIEDIFGSIYDQIGMGKIFEDSNLNSLLKNIVLARIANPFSKHKTSKILERDYGKEIPVQKIYRLMDKLFPKGEEIKTIIQNNSIDLLGGDLDVIFFDVTTLYFQSFIADDLKKFGFSKDCKFKEVQVVLAMVTTANGLPIYFEEFPGNTSEGKTLINIVEKIQSIFGKIKNVIMVADRAMFSKVNLLELENRGINYAVAAKLRSLDKSLKNKILSEEYTPTVINNEFCWLREIEYLNRKLIVTYSSKRALKDKKDRDRLLEKLRKKGLRNNHSENNNLENNIPGNNNPKNNISENNISKTIIPKNNISGKKIPVSKLITNQGNKKFTSKINGNVQLDQSKIDQDALWDGIHGIITNVKDQNPNRLLERYRGLWQIEAVFRINKNDLRIRPIYHFTPKRIKGHLLICYMAYTIVSHAMFKLKKKNINLSFEKIREELIKVESSILKDKSSKKRFRLPSSATEMQIKIYEAMNLKRPIKTHGILT